MYVSLLLIINAGVDNPLFPINVNDYPKLYDYVLTVPGLVYFQSLKRKYILDEDLLLDEYNKLRLLYVYCATTNRNVKEVFAWQDICIIFDDKGFFEKNMYQSKEDLKTQSLIVPNPQYCSGLYRQHVEYVKANMKK
jgi:hypothetical protein